MEYDRGTMIYLKAEQLEGKVLMCDLGYCLVTIDGLRRRMQMVKGKRPAVVSGDPDKCDLCQEVGGRVRARCFNADLGGYQVDETRSIR